MGGRGSVTRPPIASSGRRIILVNQAEAYKFPTTMFGHYGLGRWRERELCSQLLGAGQVVAEGGSRAMTEPPRASGKRGLEEPEAA